MPRAPHPGRRGHVQRARRAPDPGLLSPTSAVAEIRGRLAPVLLDAAVASGLDVHGRVNAAVLVPLYLINGELHAVLTRRRADLRRHAGEISFPGGREDASDSDLIHTALREAQEEIGLDPEAVTVAGALSPIPTIATSYAIYPFVGLIEPGHDWRPSATEVERVLEMSLTDLRVGYGRRRLLRRGVPFRTDTFVVSDELVWGATARILSDLLERLDTLSDDQTVFSTGTSTRLPHSVQEPS